MRAQLPSLDGDTRQAMEAMLRSLDGGGETMDMLTAAGPMLVPELKKGAPYWKHKEAAAGALKRGDLHEALVRYRKCLQHTRSWKSPRYPRYSTTSKRYLCYP